MRVGTLVRWKGIDRVGVVTEVWTAWERSTGIPFKNCFVLFSDGVKVEVPTTMPHLEVLCK